MDDPLPLEGFVPQKRCSMCKKLLPLEQFHRNRTRGDGRQSMCKPCNIERNQRWYREHPEVRASRMDEQDRRSRARLRGLLIAYLVEHPCVDCGEADPVVLDFDHLRDKVMNVSAMVLRKMNWARILDEIAKCEVVCSNCHRRRTARRANSYRYRYSLEVKKDW